MANLHSRHQPVVGVPRRHPDVHDRDVGDAPANLDQEIGRVDRATDDLVTCVSEQ